MEPLRARRIERRLSQRALAERAGVSFRTIQLLETGRHDWRISTLNKVSRALGLPERSLERGVRKALGRIVDGVADVSERISLEGPDSWPGHLFNFVDAFRRQPKLELVAQPPDSELALRQACLLASTVETLCGQAGLAAPGWCSGVGPLPEPWFVSGVESLKALALVHSPVHFRKRNLFVLDNFLDRA